MSLASNITAFRKNKNLTQAELAKKVSVDQTLISYFERGLKVPNLIMAHKIAQALGVTVDDLIK